MPGGALMQLVAYGAQDVYLTGQPKVTFFQSVYKRHTNFAMELSQQTLSGAGGNGGLMSATLARSGDLVGDMFVLLTPTPTSALQLTSNNANFDMCWVAERAFTSIQLFIGGQSIDKHYQLWFRLYSEVYLDDTKKATYGKLTSISVPNNVGQTSTATVMLPLMFFFNRNPGLYLPLIALQYHEVRIDFSLAPNYTSYFGTNPPAVWANYMYLDSAERERYAKGSHEYLIEQVQHVAGDPVISTNENSPGVVRLQYNHPVKELIWCYQDPNPFTNRNAMWNFTSSTANVEMTVDTSLVAQTGVNNNCIGSPIVYIPPLLSSNLFIKQTFTSTAGLSMNVQSNVVSGTGLWMEAGLPIRSSNVSGAQVYGVEVGPLHKFKLMLNGTDRFIEQPGKYFNQYQPYQYHTGHPYPGIYTYSFALKPEEHQPSGTCNFSRIDIAETSVYLKTGMPSNLLQKMFAVNYNVLKIASGMGGVMFSN
jgi:hypothetical protein